jgi:hypothetical protein
MKQPRKVLRAGYRLIGADFNASGDTFEDTGQTTRGAYIRLTPGMARAFMYDAMRVALSFPYDSKLQKRDRAALRPHVLLMTS